jgi:hypothetical protein
MSKKINEALQALKKQEIGLYKLWLRETKREEKVRLWNELADINQEIMVFISK